jgi:hypothetical protein
VLNVLIAPVPHVMIILNRVSLIARVRIVLVKEGANATMHHVLVSNATHGHRVLTVLQ